ncbi:hypothetical protein SRHO_G00185390 [Serrasalmus rhombeus]
MSFSLPYAAPQQPSSSSSSNSSLRKQKKNGGNIPARAPLSVFLCCCLRGDRHATRDYFVVFLLAPRVPRASPYSRLQPARSTCRTQLRVRALRGPAVPRRRARGLPPDMDGRRFQLDLERDESASVERELGLGRGRARHRCAYRGTVDSKPESLAVFELCGGRMRGFFAVDGARYTVRALPRSSVYCYKREGFRFQAARGAEARDSCGTRDAEEKRVSHAGGRRRRGRSVSRARHVELLLVADESMARKYGLRAAALPAHAGVHCLAPLWSRQHREPRAPGRGEGDRAGGEGEGPGGVAQRRRHAQELLQVAEPAETRWTTTTSITTTLPSSSPGR